MKPRIPASICAALALAAAPAAAQQAPLSTFCQPLTGEARTICVAAAQAAESAQPQLGVLIAGGNPTPGTAGGGLHLGILPRMSVTARGNVAFVRLPDIVARQVGAPAQHVNRVLGVPAPALAGTATIEVYPGMRLLPMVGGVGSVELIGGATWLPVRAFTVRGFRDGPQDVAYALGARVGLLRESFLLPGASVSLVRHRLGRVGFGDVCPEGEVPTAPPGGACVGPGDLGEFDFDLTNWSARLVVGKRLFGLGLTGGVGRDRVDSDVGFGFRFHDGTITRIARFQDVPLTETRWNAFVNGSYTLLLTSVAAELGWMRGGRAVEGFDASASDFDPRRGTLFGSLGVRIAF